MQIFCNSFFCATLLQLFATILVGFPLAFGRDLTTAEMKMCRISLGATKLDHIKSQHIRGSLHIKEAIMDKVKNERNDWFAKVYSQDESNVARKTLSIDIPQVHKRGKPKIS